MSTGQARPGAVTAARPFEDFDFALKESIYFWSTVNCLSGYLFMHSHDLWFTKGRLHLKHPELASRRSRSSCVIFFGLSLGAVNFGAALETLLGAEVVLFDDDVLRFLEGSPKAARFP